MSGAQTIREARERKGLTASKLARLVGVTRPCIYLWEHGETYPRRRYAELLEALLDLSPGTLTAEADARAARAAAQTEARFAARAKQRATSAQTPVAHGTQEVSDVS
jgi:transcriptional regulator with XRE-family HTH domain